jgi:putative ABC transport system permease protein
MSDQMSHWLAYVRWRLQLPDLDEAREAEIIEDLARQLDDAYQEALAAGCPESEARSRAERHVTDWAALARELADSSRRRPRVDRWNDRVDEGRIRSSGRLKGTDQLRHDVIYGWRMLRRNSSLAIVAVLSLALGIGANIAIFSVIHALLFRPLPIPHAEQLVVITDPQEWGSRSGIQTGERSLLSYHEFEDLRASHDVLSGIFAFTGESISAPVAAGKDPEGRNTVVRLVSGAYFPVVGVTPVLGRTFNEDVDVAQLAHPVAVISYRFWELRLQRAPDVIGSTIRIRSTPFQIIGVMPAEFRGLVVGEPPDIWAPVTMQQAVVPGADWLTQQPGTARRRMFLHVAGRLKAGISLTQATVVVNGLLQSGLRAEAALISDADRRRELVDTHVVVRDARYGVSWLRGEYREPLIVVMALVGLLLLLTCANIANLLLARSTGRRREIAMRVALGAGRGRLVRQLLTESLLLAALGAAAGLIVAYWGDRALLRLASGGATPIPLETPLEWPVLAFAATAALFTGLAFGLAPALRATRLDLNTALRAGAPNISGRARRAGASTGSMLAGAQVALSLFLLIAAGLFVRSLQRLGKVPLGYDAEHILQFRVTPTVDGYAPAAVEPLLRDILNSVGAVPGVRGVTLSTNGLFYGSEIGSDITLPDASSREKEDMSSQFDLVGPGYFSTLGIPVLSGRDVEHADAGGLPGCWVNATAARYFFGDASPIGRHIVAHFSFGNVEYETRGVVADSRSHSLRDEAARRFYLSYFGTVIPVASAVFEVRTSGDPAGVMPVLRDLLRNGDARLAAPTFHTVADLLNEDLGRDRVTARLSTLFGVMALALASIGLYGVLSYGVSRRVSEIGVRLALGAPRYRIVALVVRDALGVVAVGSILGLAGALASARLIDSLLYGLTARDPITMAGATAIILVVAALAAAVPAWRAARTDPLAALRRE